MSEPETKKITVVFCIPGRQFSNKFFMGWNDVLSNMIHSEKYEVAISNKYSSHANFARALCLGADVLAGPDQLPFQGKLDYDVIMWLDSDMVFNFNAVEYLIQHCMYKYPVVSGTYAIDDGKKICCVENWDYEHYAKNGSFEYLTNDRRLELLNSGNHWLKCAYSGMGCMAIRKGVIEDPRMKYPWFFSNLKQIHGLETDIPYISDGTSEDVTFIRNLIDNGVIDGVMVSMLVKFGHEHTIVY